MDINKKREAQARRAIERAKKEKKAKIANFLKFWGPIVGCVLVVVIIVWAIASSGPKTSDNYGAATEVADYTNLDELNDGSEQEQAVVDEVVGDTEAESTYSTDSSLVAEDGQKVNIDFKGYMGGEAFEGGDSLGQGYDLVLGSQSFIEGFEEGIIGHNVGESFTLDLKFPDDYWNSDFAGKDVSFDVTLNGIYQ